MQAGPIRLHPGAEAGADRRLPRLPLPVRAGLSGEPSPLRPLLPQNLLREVAGLPARHVSPLPDSRPPWRGTGRCLLHLDFFLAVVLDRRT